MFATPVLLESSLNREIEAVDSGMCATWVVSTVQCGTSTDY